MVGSLSTLGGEPDHPSTLLAGAIHNMRASVDAEITLTESRMGR
jgi:hypothetical protein